MHALCLKALALALLLNTAALAETPNDTWGMARSENFVVNGPSREFAAEVLSQAELYRRELALAWLGEELPTGQGPAIIHVRVSDEKDEASTWPMDSEKREHHLVWITSSADLALGSTLAHEMTHVVLATRYGDDFPVWANEGIAGICDDTATKRIRAGLLRNFARRRTWPQVAEVLRSKNISPADQQSYTVSVSLTRYLLSRGDKAQFLRFATDGQHAGWDQAAKSVYGFASVKELATAWQAWATAHPDAELEAVPLD